MDTFHTRWDTERGLARLQFWGRVRRGRGELCLGSRCMWMSPFLGGD